MESQREQGAEASSVGNCERELEPELEPKLEPKLEPGTHLGMPLRRSAAALGDPALRSAIEKVPTGARHTDFSRFSFPGLP